MCLRNLSKCSSSTDSKYSFCVCFYNYLVSCCCCSVVSNSLWPHGLKHTRIPYPSVSPEFAQTHVHWVDDAIHSSHPVSPPFCYPQFSQHQSLFQWVSSLHQVTKVWSFSFSISPSSEYSGLISIRTDCLDLLAAKGLSRVFSSTTVGRHQFFGILPSLQSSSHNQTCPLYVYKGRLRFEVMMSFYLTGRLWELQREAFTQPPVVRESSWRRHLSRAWKIKSGSASSREWRWEVSHAQGTACMKHRVRRLLSSWALGDTRAGNKVIDHSRGQVTTVCAPVKS